MHLPLLAGLDSTYFLFVFLNASSGFTSQHSKHLFMSSGTANGLLQPQFLHLALLI